MTDDEILELADSVTADFEGITYLHHGEADWVLEFAKRIIEKEKSNEYGVLLQHLSESQQD